MALSLLHEEGGRRADFFLISGLIIKTRPVIHYGQLIGGGMFDRCMQCAHTNPYF